MLQRIIYLYGAIISVTVGFELIRQSLLKALSIFIIGIGLTIMYCFLSETDSKNKKKG